MKQPISTWAIYLTVIVAIVLVSAGIYFYTRATVPPDEAIRPAATETQTPQAEAADKGVHIRGGEIVQKDEEERVLWRVRADGDMTYDDEADVARGTDIEFEINRQGKPSIGIKAPSFKADYGAKLVTFSQGDSGELLDASGDFSAPHLEYQLTTEKLIGTGGVTLHRGHYSAGADKLVVDMRNRQIRMSGNVRLERSQLTGRQ